MIIRQVKKALGKSESATLSRYEYAKGASRLRRNLLSEMKSVLLIAIGVLSAAFGLKSFLMPNGFIDGGVTGISLLLNHETGFSLALLIALLNLPFVVLLGWRQISRVFSLKSMLGITLLALAVAFLPLHAVTSDKLLVSVFGGFFLGAGIGLTIRGGGVIDGTEILAIYLNRKSSLSVGDFILLFNILIFSVAAYLLTLEVALYSVLTYLAASKTVDFVLEGIEEFTGVTIISPHNGQIAEMIKEKLGRGLTVYSGKRGYGKRGENPTAADILFTVVTRLEISRLTAEVEKIDPHAFIVTQSIKDTRGGMVKKRGQK
ncbi:MAG TPA: YitT family protein [Chitinophagaceae bacterium]|nr:YitT family protein [Chitinophagaceae bacterium]